MSIKRLFLPQLTSSRKYASVLQRAEKCSLAALNEIKSVADFNFAILSLLQGWFFIYCQVMTVTVCALKHSMNTVLVETVHTVVKKPSIDRLESRSEEMMFSDAIERKKKRDNKRQKKSVVVI